MLETDYANFIHQSRYSRFLWEEGRRETWEETVKRLIHFWVKRYDPEEIDYDVLHEVEDAILNLETMPSMRSLMTAGPALERDNVAGYNCAFTVVESIRDFDEICYILLCGTGVGYSVESKYVNKLPEVAETFHDTDTTIVVSDSKIGWASAFRELLSLLWAGKIPKWDLSRVRPAGAPLRTFGGRASGPGPLEDLFEFCTEMLQRAAGRKLTTSEVSDIVCKVAEIVVVGGVRRSALICLCDLEDDRMRNYKTGQWWTEYPHRALANISAVYEEKPSFGSFLKEWKSLYTSKSGERGIFSRSAAQNTAARNGRRDADKVLATNPCSEILLRDKQMCNLSEVIVRPDDNLEDLKRKVKLATILGTLQSTLTDFRYLRKKWRDNCEEERLLGVSLTGICDNEVMSDRFSPGDNDPEDWLEELKNVAIETNKEWAETLGINQSAAITCIKPSGTVSQLTDTASGIHPRFSRYYIRRVRQDKKDPLSQFLIDSGFTYEEDVMNKEAYVFNFPMKAPEGSLLAGDMSALDQLKLWKVYAEHWCEHKPSMTCYYTDDDFLEVGSWIWNNFDELSGISFLPLTDHNYRQAPYEAITEEQYEELVNLMPIDVDWSKLSEYENGEDNTEGAQTLSCSGNQCEI